MIVNVPVAEKVPVLYLGSLVKVQPTEPEVPAAAECASVPKVATDVAAAVLAVTLPVHCVAGEATEQVYFNVSPAVGGVATEGPPAGEKSVVIRSVMVPLPPAWVVRILYVKFVVPV